MGFIRSFDCSKIDKLTDTNAKLYVMWVTEDREPSTGEIWDTLYK